MIVHDVEQGSAAWLALRLGIPTASEFDKIITPAKGELSKSADAYAAYLLTEKLLNRTLDSIDNLEWVQRGKELEGEAAKAYEFFRSSKTALIGFCTTDDGRVGASPDRAVIGESGGLEIKCPAPQTHMRYLLSGFGDDYKVQVQGQMLVTGWEWIDRVSYHPEMPMHTERTYRDASYIRKMEDALHLFCENLESKLATALSRGSYNPAKHVATPADQRQEEQRHRTPTPAELETIRRLEQEIGGPI